MDLQDLNGDKTRWLRLSGVLSGMEVLIQRATPEMGSRLRSKLVGAGVWKADERGNYQIVQGREAEYAALFASAYVLDWRSADPDDPIMLNGVPNPEFSANLMGRVFMRCRSAMDDVSAAVLRDEDFFANGTGGGTRS